MPTNFRVGDRVEHKETTSAAALLLSTRFAAWDP